MAMIDPREYCVVDGVTLVCDANHTGVDFFATKGLFAQHDLRMKQSSCDAAGDRYQIRLTAENLHEL
jgi:hypothetical protein